MNIDEKNYSIGNYRKYIRKFLAIKSPIKRFKANAEKKREIEEERRKERAH